MATLRKEVDLGDCAIGLTSFALEGVRCYAPAINAVTAVELFEKADALPRMLHKWARLGPWR